MFASEITEAHGATLVDLFRHGANAMMQALGHARTQALDCIFDMQEPLSFEGMLNLRPLLEGTMDHTRSQWSGLCHGMQIAPFYNGNKLEACLEDGVRSFIEDFKNNPLTNEQIEVQNGQGIVAEPSQTTLRAEALRVLVQYIERNAEDIENAGSPGDLGKVNFSHAVHILEKAEQQGVSFGDVEIVARIKELASAETSSPGPDGAMAHARAVERSVPTAATLDT